jgi:site-specific DNA recombinase
MKSSTVPVPKKPYALYARVSSKSQETAGTIKTQIKEVERYAKAHQLRIGGRYKDDGVSGTIPFHERPDGSRLLADARGGKYGGVICLNHRRIGRKGFVIYQAIEQLEEELGLEIIAVREYLPPDLDGEARSILRGIYAGVAEGDRKGILRNSIEGMERAAREGRWNGGRPPFGYSRDKKTKHLVKHEKQAAIVREIFSRYRGGETSREIAESLTSRGVPHPTSWRKPGFNKPARKKPWYKGTVSNILCNPVYVGQSSWRRKSTKDYTPHRPRRSRDHNEGIPLSLPPIVTKEEYLDAMRVAENNGRFASRNTRRFYLVQNLIRCGLCGRNYASLYTGKRGSMHPYYRCGSQRCYGYERRACPNSGVRADYLDDTVWRHCADFVKNPGTVLGELRALLRKRRREQPSAATEQEQIDARLSQNRSAQKKFLRLIEDEALSYDEGARELRRLKKDAENLEAERASLLKRRDSELERENRLLSAEAMLERLSAAVDSANDKLKREIVLALVEEIVVELDEEKVRAGNKRPTIRVRFSFAPQRSVNSAERGTPNSTTRPTASGLAAEVGASVKRTRSPAA